MGLKKFITFFAMLALSIVLASCASTKIEAGDTNPAGSEAEKKSAKVKKIKYNEDAYAEAYNNRDYETCLGMMMYKAKKKGTIRDNLDVAMLQFISENYADAAATFEKVDDKMFDAVTKSITRTFAAAVGNANAKEYCGNVYESLLVNTMNSLCYFQMGDLTSAVNQLSKLSDTKLPEYRRLYGEVSVDAPSYSDDDFKTNSKTLSTYGVDSSVFSNAAPKKPGKEDVYQESALARYLSLILRQADGDKSQIDSDAMVLKSLVRDFDSADANIPSDKGRLNVLALAGLIGKQTPGALYFPSKSTYFFVPTGNPLYKAIPVQFKFVYPIYEKKYTVSGVDVALNSVGTKKTVIIENFNNDLEKSVKLRAYKEYNASVARSITKKVSGIVAGIASIEASYIGMKNVQNELLSAILETTFNALCLSTAAGLAAIDLTETPDIRQGEFFPETANAAGFTVPAGSYKGKVIYRFSDGTTCEKPFEAEVTAGKPTLVVSSCIQ